MLSRVAESVFWLARYMERTDGMLRVLRTSYIASQDEMRSFDWSSVLQTYGEQLPAAEASRMRNNSRAVLEYLVLNPGNPASLINNITRARENAKAVQDHITKETWHTLNGYYLLIREAYIHEMFRVGDPITALDALIKHGLFLYGTIDITMTRGEAYNFLNIGRYVERAVITTDITDIKLREINYQLDNREETPPNLRYLLYSLSGYEAYLRKARGVELADLVMKQILYDQDFAHSVLYCMNRISRYFKRLAQQSIPESYEQEDFLIGRSLNDLKYSNPDLNDGPGIRNLLIGIRANLLSISQGFNRYYFGHNAS
ncbi:alpha-E domain-containing protein [Niabella terrae]